MNDSFEFSRPIDVMRLPLGGGHYTIAASTEERAALAKRFDLVALERLEAEVEITRLSGGFYRLAASLAAALVQACVVTLEPVASEVEERFSLLYGPLDEAKDIVLDGTAETVEPLEGGMIDIGEAVAQQLSLALDPFPHAKDAAEAPVVKEEPRSESPFSVLAELQRRRQRS